MLNVFIDTNVILDYFLGRQPYSVHAAKILTLSEKGKIKAFISGLTIANCYYFMRKDSSHKKAIKNLEKLCDFVNVLDLKRTSILTAFKSDFKDYEDALQNETAKEEFHIKIIITRNVKDFKKSKIEVITPEMFLNILKDNQANLQLQINAIPYGPKE